jgi:hypothetical protein
MPVLIIGEILEITSWQSLLLVNKKDKVVVTLVKDLIKKLTILRLAGTGVCDFVVRKLLVISSAISVRTQRNSRDMKVSRCKCNTRKTTKMNFLS